MKKHWIFHKYKWHTETRRPLYILGLFSDDIGERRYQTGECSCGAWKTRTIDVSPQQLGWERVEPLMKYQMNVARRLQETGRIDDAIDVLKIRF